MYTCMYIRTLSYPLYVHIPFKFLSYLILLYYTLSIYIHIQWTGKCIGRKNIAYFYAFLWVVAAYVAFVIAVTIYATIIGLPVYELH